jgi:thiamine biosynthesis lipoprotein
VAASAADADALSTAAFTLGYHRGKALIDSIPGADAIFVLDDRNISLTAGLAEAFTLLSDEYVLR